MSKTDREYHVLGLSGGRDSAALAVYMREHHPELDIDYFFTDTGKELPEVYEFLVKLEGFLGKPIRRLNPDRDFDFWLKQFNNFLPSPQTRWCTRQLKLRPFEQWVRPMLEDGTTVYSYVAIRTDEEYREGYTSKHDSPNLPPSVWLREWSGGRGLVRRAIAGEARESRANDPTGAGFGEPACSRQVAAAFRRCSRWL